MTTEDGWWRGATIYALYVRSWRDSDGDGYGDLPGVVSGLDYLAWLGVDGIWLSPTMPSPDEDWGYDVSDYMGVHPDLGSLDDLDRLIAEAAVRDIRILLDLVPNHTSSRHPWFVEARTGPDSPHRDWYVWADPVDGGPPNNWSNSTGGSAWAFDAGTGQYYLHSFLDSQPDLNWWNEEVHREFERIMAFWLDRGVAGFRIDVAHGLYKDALLRDDPPASVGIGTPHGLRHDFSSNQPEVHELYRQWRRLAGGYRPERLLLGETWVMDTEQMATYYGEGDELQLAFNFSFFFCDFDMGQMSSMVERTLACLPPGGCPVWTGSNHDDSRFPTRWCGDDERRVRLALTVLCTLPGTTVLYYGDELGLGDVVVPDDRQRDRMTWHGTATRINRDRARTPMPWSGRPGAGFTAPGVEPWLPIGDRTGRTVEEQKDDPSSVLTLTRRLLRTRPRHLGYETLAGPDGVWIYRTGALTVAANFTGSAQEVRLPGGPALSSLTSAAADHAEGGRVLQPWEAVVCGPPL